jgi:anti-sigma regulatory factor (Ser/Thr protein kinase)
MKGTGEHIKIVFNNKSETISDVRNSCVSFIRDELPCPPDSELLSRLKWTLTELLTNAVKHTNRPESIILITLGPSEVIVEKQDTGDPLKILDSELNQTICWPIPIQSNHTRHILYSSGNESLAAHIQTNGTAIFVVEENQIGENTDQLFIDISEHFGLLIIAKSATEFFYRYDKDARVNSFICKFKYQ